MHETSLTAAMLRAGYSRGDCTFITVDMEVVLLWLDELDDIVFAGFSLWLRLRRSCLAIAMAAALALHVLPRFGFFFDQLMGLLYLSLASIAGWFFVAAVCDRMERGVPPVRQPA
jgi:hypothetical protein